MGASSLHASKSHEGALPKSFTKVLYQKALLAVLTSDHWVVSSSAPLLLSYNYFFKPLSSVLSTVLQAWEPGYFFLVFL